MARQTGSSASRDDMFSRKSANPFFNDEDDANSYPSSSTQTKRSGAMTHSASASAWQPEQTGGHNDDGSSERQADDDLMAQIQASRSRQLDSTRNALQSMYESEQIGVATAEELSRQGEKLNRVEMRLDSMNSTLTQTQRHLNNIKSVFGGIVNWWSKPRDATITQSQTGRGSVSGSAAGSTANGSGNGARANGGITKSKSEYSGFFSDEANGHASSDPHEQEVNQNLSEMSVGLSRLKNLAEGLNTELERQNAQIDRTVKKADVVKPRLDDQNRQMRQILGYK